MSGATDTDTKAILARIDRDMAETRKFVSEQLKLAAEQGKLQAEQEKFHAEQLKLYAEQAKLTRDHHLAPWLAIAGLVGGIVAAITLLAHLLGRG